MTSLTRQEAKDLLAERHLGALTSRERCELLQDWWCLDQDDPEWESLPAALQEELADSECPSEADDARYDPVLLIGLQARFEGVRNEWLEEELRADGHDLTVTDELEPLCACPCCRYQTLGQRGRYEVCKVCFWEDDGQRDEHVYSGVNHMTLGDARTSFACCGACDQKYVETVVKFPSRRYPRAPIGALSPSSNSE